MSENSKDVEVKAPKQSNLNEPFGKESKRHLQLKRIAKIVLKQMGYDVIWFEVPIHFIAPKAGQTRLDVLAFDIIKKKTIAIECVTDRGHTEDPFKSFHFSKELFDEHLVISWCENLPRIERIEEYRNKNKRNG